MPGPLAFEICVDSVAAVCSARDAGAARVELCSALFEGGLTPSRGMIRQARRIEGIGLHVIIRPRGGDFLFDDDEFAAQLGDIETAKAEGAEGVVIGILTRDGKVDAARCARLIAAARPMRITFHRAFDMTADAFEALDTLIGLGVERVLTSGQDTTALEGLPLIAELVRRAAGRIIVMPGGGITPRNAARIGAGSGCAEMHFAALEAVDGPMAWRRTDVFMGGELRVPEYGRMATSSALIGAVIDAARSTPDG